jgi:exodeoxyribonuclease V gamma subunit
VPHFEQRDGSIEIRSCHNPLRELEALHQYLLQKFTDDDELAPDDILVVTPDINYYAPFIQAVFGITEEKLPKIPFHIAGKTNRGSGIKPAFLDLMEISGSRFRKEQVIDFMHHSAVRDRFQLSDADLSLIKQWFDENRVVWGLDGVHRSEFQQPDEEMQTWHHAFRRGWLGQLMVEKPGTVSNGMLLYSGISSADEKLLWAKVNSIIRYLGHVKKRSRQKLNLSEWEAELKEWLDFLISDKPEFENERKFVTGAIEQAVKDAVIGQITDKVHFSLMHNVLIDKLNNTSGSISFFTRGVLFNSMVPVRSLPFKIIALLGLNDDQFPRQPVKPEFDLMNTQRKPGERDRKSEDRNLFLESVISAEDVHYSSYIGRNLKDDEAVPPSPILDEWIHLVAKCYQTEPEECVRQERLNGFSIESFLKGSEESFSREYMGLVKGLMAERNASGLEVDIELSLPDHLLDGIVSLDNLAAFYRNPTGSFFRNRLDIHLNGTDDKEDEFRVDGLSNHILFQYIFGWLLNSKEKEWAREIMLLSGYLPEGWPGESKMNEIIRMAEYGIAQIRESGNLPGRVRHNIDIHLDQYVLKGFVTSFSQKGMLDIHLSSESGRSMLLSWIRHLALCYETGDKDFGTEVLYDLKKGNSKWKRFQYEPDAGKILRELIEIYFDGMKSPLNLYIDSAYVYATNIEKDESTAMNYAVNEWGGDYKMYPERSNRYIELMLGKEAKADREQIADISEKLYVPMIRNMEGVS